MKKIVIGIAGVLLFVASLSSAQQAQSSDDKLASAHSMIQVLKSSRDQAEDLVAQLHARLQKSMKEIEDLKNKKCKEVPDEK